MESGAHTLLLAPETETPFESLASRAEVFDAVIENSEHALLLRAHHGDQKAASTLYRQNAERLFRSVGRILGYQNADVEDTVQVAFLSALGAAPSFDGRSSVSTWMTGIAMRKALDQLRIQKRQRRWATLASQFGECASRIFAPARFSAPNTIVEHDLAERALRTLSANQRAVFLLIDVEGLTLEEASVALETGVSTLHARLKNARTRVEAAATKLSSQAEAAR